MTPACTRESHAAAKADPATWSTWQPIGWQDDLELRNCPRCNSTIGRAEKADDVTTSASAPSPRLLLITLTADEIQLVAAALTVQTQFAVCAPGLADTARVELMQDIRSRLMARLKREG